ncbi:sensor histidine kinase [Streptomyces sp. SAS_272]|uniref:sensor histidine kinase n=1 Tax=Streptomyces sp. SAS_272 TaxID=3412747 RepID=UPI00403C0702
MIGAISRPTLSLATVPHALYTAVGIGCVAALVFRRVLPRLALTVIAVLLLVNLTAGMGLGAFVAVIFAIAAYSTQTQLSPPWRWLFLAAVYVGSVAAIMTAPIPSPAVGLRERLIVTGVALALLTLAMMAGVVRRHRRTRYTFALERAKMLETQQATERRLDVVEERTRIAREMHDVLGHSLNAIAAQAEGLRYVLRSDTGRADQALADIGNLCRRAVDDVRGLIDVLTTEESEASTSPAPSLGDVPELISSLHYTRAAIRLRVVGEPEAVPEYLGLAAYRIVQESLTNALKHADGAPITVSVTIEEHRLELSVLNMLPRAASAQSMSQDGHGINGMRERVRAAGGSVEVGPDTTTGGWRVHAVLPWGRS